MLKLIRNRAALVLAGIIASLCPLLMAPSGGYPSNPQFQTVGITQTGGGSFGQLALNATQAATSNYIVLSNGGTNKAIILNERVAGGNCGGDAVDDLCLRALSGNVRVSNFGGTAYVPAAAPITCTSACSGAALVVGQSVNVIKTADTVRTSTTTLTNDPDLQVTSVPVGRYLVEFALQYLSAINAGAGGVNWGGTCTTCTSQQALIMGASGSTVGVNTSNGFNNGAAITSFPASTLDVHYISQFTVNVTGASTIAILWAQNTSGATGSALRAGSEMSLTRLQ